MALFKYTPEQLKEKGLDPEKFCGHYSDQGFYIQKVGTTEIYVEALDLLPCNHNYIETTEKHDFKKD